MRWTALFCGCLCSVLTGQEFYTFHAPAPAPTPAPVLEQWGTIKGRVVWGPEKLPQNPDKDLIIDPKTKTVKYAFVWLMPDSRDKKDLVNPVPIHPDLRGLKEPFLTIEIGNAQFDPHLIALREGQFLQFKNKTNVIQSVKADVDENAGNTNVNLILPAALGAQVGPFKAQRQVILLESPLNPKMQGYVRVFSHPYFYVTDANGEFILKNAPAGKYRLVVWHPANGWVVGDKEPDKFGMRIDIPAGKELDLGDLKMKP